MSFPNLTLLLFLLTVFCGAAYFAFYVRFTLPKNGTLEWVERATKPPRFRFEFTLHPMTRRDIAPLAIILVVLGAISFYKLGDFTAPQTFHRFSEGDESRLVFPSDGAVDANGGTELPGGIQVRDGSMSTIIVLPEGTRVTRIMFYTGLWVGHYELDYSSDGRVWTNQPSHDFDKHPTAMAQTHADLFKWRYADITPDGADPNYFASGFTARFLRITFVKSREDGNPIELGEIVIFNENNEIVKPIAASRVLFDEQELVPERPSYMNSMYFDEIYHGRAAYETVRSIYPYETVHPPLGKTIISIGVSLFHMTPFGWRCMGTLFGVLMLAALYVLIKNMFGKTIVATCGTLLLGFDFMRFTQTRISTVDTYPVFFIILAYLYMYRYLTTSPSGKFRDNTYQLFLSGLFFGIGVATKWVVLYAGAGLLAMYILKLVFDYKYHFSKSRRELFGKHLIKTLAVTAVFFLVIPAAIYVLSYIPYGHARGKTVGTGMLWDAEYYKMIWTTQVNTFKYHSQLTATHPYQSMWYQWVANARPILYYVDRPTTGMKSTFAAFSNPLIAWGGAVAVLAMVYQIIRNKSATALVVLIGFFSQLGPWMAISRAVFAYHYFPSTIFLILALAHTFDTCVERGGKLGRRLTVGFTSAAGVLFALFYPALSGIAMPESYFTNVLRWFRTWPL